ncbi:TonB-dependent receptor [Porticoccaceae bacterium LTM1]|nr:TonB-dependent receptor [Porticoccaceae bacterium LTM1]
MRRSNIFTRNALVLGVTSAIALSVSMNSFAADDDKIQVDIQSQSIGQAVRLLAKDAGVQIIMPSDLGGSFQVKALQGEYSLIEALDILMVGSGLKYEFLSESSVAIFADSVEGDADSKEIEEEIEDVVVTGSRIRGSRPTASMVMINSDEISMRGFTTVEQILNTLPQNQSTTNSASTVNEPGSKDGYATSAANLRGLGASATLVLINGRRTSTSPTTNAGSVNLTNIPASAVERVEVSLDGASAIYGADAIGGVINIILKDGSSLPDSAITTLRFENVAHGGNNYKLAQDVSLGWDSGSLALNLSTSQTQPVESAKVGFTSKDFRSMGGTDRRDNLKEVSGYGALSANDPGIVPLTPADLSGTGRLSPDNVEKAAGVRKYSGADTQNESLSLRLKQEFGDQLEVFADLNYSENSAVFMGGAPVDSGIVVPTSNAFNNTGENLVVRYSFENEFQMGLISPETTHTDQERLDATVGFTLDLPFNEWRVGGYVMQSEENSKFEWENTLFDQDFNWSQGLLDALSDSDPSTALNLFGNGSVQNPETLQSILFDHPISTTVSELRTYDLHTDGVVTELPGGSVNLALATEYRTEELDYSGAASRRADSYPTPEISRDVKAVSAEVLIPVIGNGNQLPGVDSLTMNLAARWEETSVDGLRTGSVTYSKTSPRLGVNWQPIEDVTVRASLGSSFRAPTLDNLFSIDPFSSNPIILPTLDPRDPLGQPFVWAALLFNGNPELKPEEADNLSVGAEWQPSTLDGLSLSMTYSKIEFENAITNVLDLYSFDWNAIVANEDNLPGVVTRDSDGFLQVINAMPINSDEVVSETLDINVRYNWETDYGTFDAIFAGTYTMRLGRKSSLIAESETSTLGFSGGPLRWKANAALGWSHNNYGANLYAYYSHHYKNRDGNSGIVSDASVEHMTTYDLTGYYDFENIALRLRVGAQNLLNTKFPFAERWNTPFDSTHYDPRGRILFVELEKTFDL